MLVQVLVLVVVVGVVVGGARSVGKVALAVAVAGGAAAMPPDTPSTTKTDFFLGGRARGGAGPC